MKQCRILSAFLLLLLFGAAGSFVPAVHAQSRGAATETTVPDKKPKIDGKAGILMDAKSGKIVYEKNIDKRYYPASITKILTTLVVIENNKDLNSIVTFSRNAVNSIEPGSSSIATKAGEKMRLIDVLYAIMLESSNESCNGAAEYTSGSIGAFVDLMNKKAEELGCKNTHFMNPNGLHNKDHYVTARDMALITKAALENATFRTIAGARSWKIAKTNKEKKRELWNHHKMVKNTMFHYDGVEGGKTGYTTKAGGTLVTFAKRDNTEFICVILRGNGYELYKDTTKLFQYGYNNYRSVTPFESLNPVLVPGENLPIRTAYDFYPYTLPITNLKDFSVLITKNEDPAKVRAYTADNNIYALYDDRDIGNVPIRY